MTVSTTIEPRRAAERGELHVADRVVAKIAGKAADEVAGVTTRRGGGLGRWLGDGPFDATATLRAGHADVAVSVIVAYPVPLFETADRVRNAVRLRLEDLVGLRDPRIDVEVAAMQVQERATHSRWGLEE